MAAINQLTKISTTHIKGSAVPRWVYCAVLLFLAAGSVTSTVNASALISADGCNPAQQGVNGSCPGILYSPFKITIYSTDAISGLPAYTNATPIVTDPNGNPVSVSQNKDSSYSFNMTGVAGNYHVQYSATNNAGVTQVVYSTITLNLDAYAPQNAAGTAVSISTINYSWTAPACSNTDQFSLIWATSTYTGTAASYSSSTALGSTTQNSQSYSFIPNSPTPSPDFPTSVMVENCIHSSPANQPLCTATAFSSNTINVYTLAEAISTNNNVSVTASSSDAVVSWLPGDNPSYVRYQIRYCALAANGTCPSWNNTVGPFMQTTWDLGPLNTNAQYAICIDAYNEDNKIASMNVQGCAQ